MFIGNKFFFEDFYASILSVSCVIVIHDHPILDHSIGASLPVVQRALEKWLHTDAFWVKHASAKVIIINLSDI